MRRLAFVAILSLFAATSDASLILVTDRSLLQEDDSIAWSTFGGDLTPLPSPFNATTAQGVGFTLDGSSAFTLFSGATYNSDFLPSDTVVSNFDLDEVRGVIGGIRIVFLLPYSGGGAQIQGNEFGPFNATLEAFGLGGVSLGSFSINGTNNGSGDGSAPFLGVQSTGLDIYGLEFTLGPAMAINHVTLSAEETTVVPEPSTGALLVLGAGLLAAARRARA